MSCFQQIKREWFNRGVCVWTSSNEELKQQGINISQVYCSTNYRWTRGRGGNNTPNPKILKREVQQISLMQILQNKISFSTWRQVRKHEKSEFKIIITPESLVRKTQWEPYCNNIHCSLTSLDIYTKWKGIYLYSMHYYSVSTLLQELAVFLLINPTVRTPEDAKAENYKNHNN